MTSRKARTRLMSRMLEKIERVRQHRRHKFYLRDERITLSHGSGGKATHNLIEGVFAPAFANPMLDRMDDSAIGLDFSHPYPRTPISNLRFRAWHSPPTPTWSARCSSPAAISASWPCMAPSTIWRWPARDPLYLSAGFILEEGFAIADLRRIVDSMAAAAAEAGVTDRHRRHQGGAARQGRWRVHQHRRALGWFRPIGRSARPRCSRATRFCLSGSVGDHGIAIMLAREALEMETDVQSDTAPLHTLVAALLAAVGSGIHCLKDPTRGGIATTLNEIALTPRLGLRLTNTRSRCIPACAVPARSWGSIR